MLPMTLHGESNVVRGLTGWELTYRRPDPLSPPHEVNLEKRGSCLPLIRGIRRALVEAHNVKEIRVRGLGEVSWRLERGSGSVLSVIEHQAPRRRDPANTLQNTARGRNDPGLIPDRIF